jgi:pimeloyl-ACP methyl ester carboxylesterase
MDTCDVHGYPLAYETRGSGVPVLLIHGSLVDQRAWHQQMDALGSGYRVVAPSLRHCWPERWDGRGSEFTVEQHARDLVALLDTLAWAPAHVVGHSRGGAVAIELARTQPDRIRSLVLADPGGLEALLSDTPDGRAMARESSEMFERLGAELAHGDVQAAARAFVDALGGPGTWAARPSDQRQILLDNIVTGPHCARRPAFTASTLAELPGPMLLVTGARSPRRYRIMLEALRALRADRPALAIVPDAAHAMNRDNPAAFNATLRAFLATVPGEPARSPGAP